MISETFASTAGLACAAAFTGFAFGLAYFAALRQSVARFAAEGGWLGLSAFTVGRLIAVGMLLTLAAKLGAAPLLATFLGFLLARFLALRSARGRS